MPEYILPFDPRVFKIEISQGRNGPYSHFNRPHPIEGGKSTDLTNAIDFILPLGAFVLAARSGIFYGGSVKSETVYEGIDSEVGNALPYGSANFVVIKHEDETYAVYSHLARDGSLLKKFGEEVMQGQQIAITGKSGWIGPKPHLHFQVMNKDHNTIPVSFENYDGPLEHADLRQDE